MTKMPCFTEATTEVEALRKALAKAEGKVVQQQAAHKKLKARVGEVQQGAPGCGEEV